MKRTMLVCVLCLCVAGVTQAGLVADFEEPAYSIGDPVGAAFVVDDGGNQVLKLDNPSSTSNQNATLTFPTPISQTDDTKILSFDVKWDTTADISIGLSESATPGTTWSQFGPYVRSVAGVFGWRDGGSFVDDTTGLDVTTDYVNIELVLYNTTETYDIYADGVLMAAGAGYRDQGTNEDLLTLNIMGKKGIISVDNIQISEATDVAHNPYPENTATDVPVNATLSWTTAIDPLTGVARTDVVNHLVYLSAPNDPNLTTVTAVPVADTGTGSASYTPATELARDAVYTWRVDEELTGGTILEGSEWSFETVPSTPVVTTQPAVDTLVDAGTAVDLTVEALNPFTSDDTGMTYQWYHGVTPVGTDSVTLSIPSAQIADEGEYYCVVTITPNGATAQSDSGWVNVKRTVQYHAFDGDLTDTVGVNDGVYTNVDPNLVTLAFDTGFDGVGQAISLNGQEYVNLGLNGYPRAKSVMEHGTVACWIKTATDGKMMGIANDQPQYYTTAFEYGLSSGGLRAFVRDDDNTAISRTGGTVNDDVWHFAVIAWNASPEGAELTVYVDGASKGTSTNSGRFQPFGDWVYDIVIGASNSRGTVTDFFTGLIDELKVYNYALTADDVAVAYEGYTGLDTCVHPP
ncbi:MAG: immunoglobulin domain-containing protein, partial [Anaerohalosphaera sp.]|nr:immunoglobulin domain-containing protein [Anaerohalosphaera sp.]